MDLSADFVAGSAGLVLGRDGWVLRGSRATYSFTVDGPLEVEPEDVPEEVLAQVPELRAVQHGRYKLAHAVTKPGRLAG
ncbi:MULTISPECIES: hypothetical protein [unclassified Kribbella]|uniref:hypothetical protein n=1 Tax=unclassified Kribbella TaxID=2644121 RepID=UPI0030192BF9